ncbi:MAG: 1,2-phenylacetyl-CoA epoxidase subunit PaaD [Woeseiaceae bacterium]
MIRRSAQTIDTADAAQIRAWLAEIPDPEIPLLSIVDLGMIRDVRVGESGVEVDVSPTYSGCPATEAIEQDIVARLGERGVEALRLRRVLSPPWTTDWITAAGREKLRAAGIAPPQRGGAVPCPRCGSPATERVSEFGSTACKASWRCTTCLEPFEYFKCL